MGMGGTILTFSFWEIAMADMKVVIPKYGPIFVFAFCTILAGFLLIAFVVSCAPLDEDMRVFFFFFFLK